MTQLEFYAEKYSPESGLHISGSTLLKLRGLPRKVSDIDLSVKHCHFDEAVDFLTENFYPDSVEQHVRAKRFIIRSHAPKGKQFKFDVVADIGRMKDRYPEGGLTTIDVHGKEVSAFSIEYAIAYKFHWLVTQVNGIRPKHIFDIQWSITHLEFDRDLFRAMMKDQYGDFDQDKARRRIEPLWKNYKQCVNHFNVKSPPYPKALEICFSLL
jgi:hypothetical protein